MADERAWLVSGCARAAMMLGRLRGPHARLGGQAGLAGLACKDEQAWAAAAPSSFLSLLFLLLRFKFS